MGTIKQKELAKIFLAIAGSAIIGGLMLTNLSPDLGLSENAQIMSKKSETKREDVAKENVWKRPDGPLKVGLQVGHWKNQELPDELARLKKNGGTQGGGKAEWEVNLAIAQEIAKILEKKGIVADIIPATVPEQYWADVVVAIHADGNEDPETGGFKVAAPWRDLTNKSAQLARLIEERYEVATKMKIDPNVTRNMRGYYAFNWRKYRHSIHPMSTAVIIETGFLTNANDRKVLVHNPALAAEGISQGIIDFFDLS